MSENSQTAGPNLAVIPARGGSKRIPRKNIKLFAGRPMIAYAIDAARRTGLFDHVVVSTDDAEIAEIARAEGAETPFARPAGLADDFTPTVPVIAHAVAACREAGWAVENACCIYPAVPLIEPGDLVAAYDALIAGDGTRYVFPVAAYPSPIQRALRRDPESGTLAPFSPEYASTRTQDLEPAFYDAGQFYWGPAALWLEGKNLHANARAIVLPEWRVADIDMPEDWERAELLAGVLKGARQP